MTSAFVERLDRVVPKRMQELGLPGAALALIDGGRVSTLRCWGLADRETAAPLTEHTVFRLASISKSFAAWAVMTLVERGDVNLDAPIERYVRRWRLPPSPHDAAGVTVRRLLTHTAGVSVEGLGQRLPERTSTLVEALNNELPAAPPDCGPYQARWKLPDAAPTRLAWPPGQGFHYSNAGFALLELMVEEVSGQRFAAYVEQAVLRPLGLTHAGFVLPPGPASATAYSEAGHAIARLRPLCAAAGGLCASIRDLARFACAEMAGPDGEPAGRGVLSSGSMAAMFTSHGPAEHDESSGLDFEAGLGHMLCSIGGAKNVHHSGGFVGWRSIYSVFPELGAGLCMLINSDGGNELWQPLIQDWGHSLGG